MLRLAACLSLLAAITACSSIHSEDIDTDAISADILVDLADSGSNVDVTLQAGALTFIDLTGDDALSATAKEQTVPLAQQSTLGVEHYTGHLDADAAGDVVTVAFARTAFSPAPDSHVALPARVAVTGPAAGTSVSRDNDDIALAIGGDAPDAGATISWSGDCVDGGQIEVPAGQTGITIAKGTIHKRTADSGAASAGAGSEAPAAISDICVLHVVASRSTTGVLDPAWGGGSIFARTSASLDLTTAP